MASAYPRRFTERGYSTTTTTSSSYNNNNHRPKHERAVWTQHDSEDADEGYVNDQRHSWGRRDTGSQEGQRFVEDRASRPRYETEARMYDGRSGYRHKPEPRGIEGRTGGHGGFHQRPNYPDSGIDNYRPRPTPVWDAPLEDYLPNYRKDHRNPTVRSNSSTMDKDVRRYSDILRDSFTAESSCDDWRHRRHSGSSTNNNIYYDAERVQHSNDRWKQSDHASRYNQEHRSNGLLKEGGYDYDDGQRHRFYQDNHGSYRDLDDNRRTFRKSLSPERHTFRDVRPEHEPYRRSGPFRDLCSKSNHLLIERNAPGNSQDPSSLNHRCFARQSESAVPSLDVPRHQRYEPPQKRPYQQTLHPKRVNYMMKTAEYPGRVPDKRPFSQGLDDVCPPSKRCRQSEQDGSHQKALGSSNKSSNNATSSIASKVADTKVLTAEKIPMKTSKSTEWSTITKQSSTSFASKPITTAAPLLATKETEVSKSNDKLAIPLKWLKPSSKAKAPTPPHPSVSLLSQAKSQSSGIVAQAMKKAESDQLNTTSVSKSERGDGGFEQPRLPTQLHDACKQTCMPSSPSNRMVTDTSEGGSTISNKEIHLQSLNAVVQKEKKKVPVSIVTKSKMIKFKKVPAPPRCGDDKEIHMNRLATNIASDIVKMDGVSSVVSPLGERYTETKDDEWDSDAQSESQPESDIESDIEDEETELWAARLLGKAPLEASSFLPTDTYMSQTQGTFHKAQLQNVREKELEKLQKKKKRDLMKKKASVARSIKRNEFDEEKARQEMEEERRKREEANPLSAEEIKAILGDEDFSGGDQNNWVRRSVRQPSRALLNSKPVKMLIDLLRMNHPEMKVLKMKKFVNDPNAPSAVLDAALNAMEENTNCEALYIQNFNEGMRDQQVLHLLRILQQPSCKIWCLNIGENYNVGDETWEKFTKGLVHTKITHMYASEHTITGEMKEEIRETIRENRKKHSMHNDPNNLDVIIQCTHCWWNPINAKVLRPYLKKKGYEHILNDKEAQGLRGSTSAAPTE
ncbi:hypothetical protein IV203_028667 [Nitzschia inconspicua]|uniref:Uncharacterized protein n=1 Tax=Nitzschia inconspicua TaxID=303405 RepID=A0A9K3PZM8_9STRA|nr:hypothetical protein IV203_028667 [Nitzschia inconspicua]